MKKPKFKTIPNITLRNKLSGDTVVGDIINEDVIEGKLYFVLRQNSRVLKYAKDSYSIVKR